MVREDVQRLLMRIQVDFPQFRAPDKTVMIESWTQHLKDYSAEEMALAYESYCKSNSSGFAPSVSQLINETEKVKDLAVMDESEAWALVRKAIGRGAYNSENEFKKLPPPVQRAVGSAGQLFNWATDENYNDGVVMSQFLRSYRTTTQRQRTFERLPEPFQAKVNALVDKLPRIDGEAVLLGVNSVTEVSEEKEPVSGGEYLKRLEEKFKGE